jgi:hypothetical protein
MTLTIQLLLTAIDLVRWELSMHVGDQDTGGDPLDLPKIVFRRWG